MRCVLSFSLLLTACATGNPRVPDAMLPSRFEAPAPAGNTQLDRWWMLYGDAQLTELIDEALRRGFSAREALARLEEARLVRRTALARFGPSAEIQGSASLQQIHDLEGGLPTIGDGAIGPGIGALPNNGGLLFPGRIDTYSLGLPVSWELDLFGRRGAARRSADADLEASVFAYQGMRATLAADVAYQLFQARALAVQIADAREAVRIHQELRRIVGIRAEHGLAPRADVDRIDVGLATTSAQTVSLEGELFAVRRTLLGLLGRASDPVERIVVTDGVELPPAVPVGLPADLLLRRPDVLEARARLDGALGHLRAAELAQFPAITLTSGAGLAAQRGDFRSVLGFWSLGVGLVVPLLDRRRLRNEVRINDARTEQAVLAFERTIQTAFSESDQTIARLEADRRRAVMLAEGASRARAVYDAASMRFRRGLTDLQTVLDAEAAWRIACGQATAARLDALLRSVQLFKVLGGGWDADGLLSNIQAAPK